MKKTILFLTMLIGMIGIQSCGNSKKNMEAIEKEVNGTNSECPISLGMFGDLQEIRLDKEAKEIVATYLNNDSVGNAFFADIDIDLFKHLMVSSNQHDKNTEFLQLLVDEGISFRSIYDCTILNDTIDFTITPDEITNFIADPISEMDVKKIQLKAQLAMNNAKCPVADYPGTQLIEISEEGNNVVFVYRVDEEIEDCTIEDIQQSLGVLKDELFIDVMGNDDYYRICNLASDLNKELILRFKGIQSGERFDITFSNDDLKSYFKDFLE